MKAFEKEISIELGLNTGEKSMAEHIVTGTTEEERKKEIYDYAIQCGWDKGWARSYAITLGKRWMPELEQNYIEFLNHLPLSDIKVGEITLNSLFAYWGRKDLTTAVRLLWLYKKDHYDDPDSVYTGGVPDVIMW